MSISPSFDTGALRIRLKTAEDKVKAFESGEKYVQMQGNLPCAKRSHALSSASWKWNARGTTHWSG